MTVPRIDSSMPMTNVSSMPMTNLSSSERRLMTDNGAAILSIYTQDLRVMLVRCCFVAFLRKFLVSPVAEPRSTINHGDALVDL